MGLPQSYRSAQDGEVVALLIALGLSAQKLAEFAETETLADTEAADALVEPHTAFAHGCAPHATFTEAERHPAAAKIKIENPRNNRDTRILRGAAVVVASASSCHGGFRCQ